MRVLIIVIILTTQACAYNWRAQYSGNDYREITPELQEILTNPDKKINKDDEKK